MAYKERLQQNNTDLNEILTDLDQLPNMPVPNPPAVYQNLEVTENGTYTAGAGYDAIGQVTVAVESGPAFKLAYAQQDWASDAKSMYDTIIFFEENQTWRDYCNSTYNIWCGESQRDNLIVVQDQFIGVQPKSGVIFIMLTQGDTTSFVRPDDLIIENYHYWIYNND